MSLNQLLITLKILRLIRHGITQEQFLVYSFMILGRLAIKNINAPKRITIVNASRNPINCAIKPIMGGPTKKPTNPTLLTAAKAADGIMLFSFVARI